MKIHSIRTSEFIAPGATIQWQSDQEGLVLMETFAPVIVVWRKFRELIRPRQIVLGKKFRVLNLSTTEFIHVRGLIFRGEEITSDFPQPVILNEPHEAATTLFSLFSKVDGIPLPDEIDLQADFGDSLLIRGKENAAQTRNPTGKIDLRLIMVNRYIRQHYHQPLTLKDLADRINCNPTYLSNTYSKVFKISPIRHLQILRMEKAKELLQHSDWNVGKIAGKLGYVSSSQFCVLFKRYHGMTPIKYRDLVTKIKGNKS